MTALEQLRRSIDAHQQRLRSSVPSDRAAAITALVRAIDRRADDAEAELRDDLIVGRHRAVSGGNTALQLCLEAAATGADPDGWAEPFLRECGDIAVAEQVVTHCETGFMLVVEAGDGAFDAWIASRRPPASWLERADFDWWASRLAHQHQAELTALQTETMHHDEDGGRNRRIAILLVESMSYQIGYPPDASIGGCTIRTYGDVLVELIARALGQRGDATAPQSGRELAMAIAAKVPAGLAAVERAIAAFTVDAENVAYHASVPGIAAAPLVRVDADRLVWSLHGLITEPLLFLSRELRRRFAQEYHDSAYLREGVFRADLYALFQDKRFVTSANRIELRRASGDIRTDIDAAVFDRKTGTLAFFELKSQDPFARSTAELHRQRDNLLHANRQVSGVLTWLNRGGAADDLLNRVDQRTAKRFRVQKVYPFVLGRYLAHFPDGPEPDRRAAWGAWPQILRLLDGQPLAGANPLASLFTRLSKDAPPIAVSGDLLAHEIAIGGDRLTVYPSYSAYQERTSR